MPVVRKSSVGKKPGLIKRIASSPTARKVAVGAGVALAGVAGVAIGRRLMKGAKRGNTTQKLKAKVVRKMLKIKNIQLDRKLLREQLKGI